ncbi:type I polyketide synthase [Lihuaxuella thermophila]|uniref:Acyl transferase domain-containing protein n=1 Tax=Lihuaxuella thermophila TaxID=1173111 RepID=A0A1H8C478_9BACL|nr:type I polyketide synthase [Lihuaxuella thermophila]SEM89772.1 Acyl transferase domain-containing protein [Lihuaxuella thermophila]
MKSGVDAISEVPKDRWDLKAFYNPSREIPGRLITRWGGFLDQIDQFDASFFGISPREAALMDPQQRLLLEVTWECLEDAGQVPEKLAGSKTGVFMGGFTLDYKLLQFSESNRHLVDSHTATGAMMTLLANRLSYVFDFQGPSVAVDTACSSSLVAVHLACQSLWNGETDLALAGGVNIMLKPDYTIAESKAGMLSPDGRSKTWDSSANGYVRGEGAGVILLKPLSQALADGDPIHALIRATGVNQDGHSNGITVPRREAQEALLREVYSRAGVSPGQIQYVEAHGTGTPVGDPIEVNALGSVLSEGRPEGEKCFVGSVKTNIGHTEAAAGVAGLIKAVLCLKHKQIPPNLHLKNPNPSISFEKLRLQVAQELTPWPDAEGPALAGVNSFGFGGTNAHVLLEEAPGSRRVDQTSESLESQREYLLPLSARSPEALKDLAESFQGMLTDGEQDIHLHHLGYTASLRRSHHEDRLALVVRSKEKLSDHLKAYVNDELRPGMSSGRVNIQRHLGQNEPAPPSLAFVFAGMGPQWWAMGRELLEKEPVFRETVEKVDKEFTKISGWSLLKEMCADEAESRMDEAQVAQPANFALQLGLAALWRSWGIRPDAIVGHSAGEVAAAYEAGVYSLEDAVRIIYHRSRLQQRMTGLGKLAAVGLPLSEAKKVLEGFEEEISIAAINSPNAVTLVGDPAALEKVLLPLQEKGVFTRYLHGKVPYHSHYMDPLREELLDVLQDINPRQASIPLYSTAFGKLSDGREWNAEYWWKNVREPVYFSSAIEALIEANTHTFLELSPHPVLTSSIKECLAQKEAEGTVVHSLRRKEPERAEILGSLGALYTLGFAVDWNAFYPEGGQVVKLPSYPWQRVRHWQESEASEQDRLGTGQHPLLGRRLRSPYPTWEVQMDKWHRRYLDDHRIQGEVVYPGAAYVEMGLAAAREAFGDRTSSLYVEDIEFHKALFLNEEKVPKMQVLLDPNDGSFRIYSTFNPEGKDWNLHASGKVQPQNSGNVTKLELNELKSRIFNEIPREECYRQFKMLGLEYGETFQGIERLWQGSREALAEIRIPEALEHEIPEYQVHPAVLDVCFQVMAAALPFADPEKDEVTVYMPTGVKQGRVRGNLRSHMWIYATIEDQQDEYLRGDIFLLDQEGNIIIEIQGCRAKSLTQDAQAATSAQPPSYYELKWVLKEEESKEPAAVTQQPEQAGNWLIFADEQGVGQALAKKLEEQGQHAILVYPGDGYTKDGERHYRIHPANPEDMQALLEQVLEGNQCSGLVHLWSLNITAPELTTTTTLQQAEELGCISVLHLVQSLAKRSWRRAPKLWLVTRGAQQVGEEAESVNPAQASLWGMARVLGHQEHKDLYGGIIDLDLAGGDDSACLFEAIWNPGEEDQIAFRGGKRYVARLHEHHNFALPVAPTFRPDASYLITGGFGALGLLVARWMIRQGARRLLLVGRGALPPRSEWSRVTDSRLAERIQAVRELESMGASVHVIAADVSREEEIVSALQDYEANEWPPVRGVVHSAGVALPQLMLQMDAKAFTDVLRPKVMGAWNLHRYFADKPLDFFVLFSSIASLVVSPGQGNYAAGNAYMDALAGYRQSLGLPAVSINWGPWAEVGMATKLDLTEFFERRGNYPFTPQQGLEALGHILGQSAPQVAVATANWPVVAEMNYPMGVAPAMLADLLEEEKQNSKTETEQNNEDFVKGVLLAAPSSERPALLESYLQDLAASVLRMDRSKLNVDQSLSTLGLDSMMAIDLKNRMEKKLGVSLAVVDLLKGPTVKQLAANLLPQLELEEDDETAELLAELEQLSEEEIQALLEEVATTEEMKP